MTVVYYGMGGGHGHAMRGLAILSRLQKHHNIVGTLLAPKRFEQWALFEGIDIQSPTVECRTHKELSPWVADALLSLNPKLLLVDVFPRGVLGELEPQTRQWLITRYVTPDYYLDRPVRDAISRYERVWFTEEPPQELNEIQATVTGPALIRAQSACLSREQAREAMGVPMDATLVLGLGSGPSQRQLKLSRLLSRIVSRLEDSCQLCFVSTELPNASAYFPLMAYMRAADCVVAAGGYHAFHETRAVGVPTVFVPQNRQVDRQFNRVRGRMVAESPSALEQQIKLALNSCRPKPVNVEDGAHVIASAVARTLMHT